MTRNRKPGAGRRGAAMVEMALLLPVLLGLVMGIIEFGMIGHHKLTLVQASRAGARQAAIGQSVGNIRQAVKAAAPGMTIADNQILVEFTAVPDGSVGWLPLPDAPDGLHNAAPTGTMVRVRVDGWPHQLVAGPFFSWLPGVQNNQLPLSGQMVMRKE